MREIDGVHVDLTKEREREAGFEPTTEARATHGGRRVVVERVHRGHEERWREVTHEPIEGIPLASRNVRGAVLVFKRRPTRSMRASRRWKPHILGCAVREALALQTPMPQSHRLHVCGAPPRWGVVEGPRRHPTRREDREHVHGHAIREDSVAGMQVVQPGGVCRSGRAQGEQRKRSDSSSAPQAQTPMSQGHSACSVGPVTT